MSDNPPDPRDRLIEIRLVNPTTGERESFGILAKRRQVGPYSLRLTYDEVRRLWWIILHAESGSIATVGYTEARRVVAWDLFTNGNETDIVNNLLAN